MLLLLSPSTPSYPQPVAGQSTSPIKPTTPRVSGPQPLLTLRLPLKSHPPLSLLPPNPSPQVDKLLLPRNLSLVQVTPPKSVLSLSPPLENPQPLVVSLQLRHPHQGEHASAFNLNPTIFCLHRQLKIGSIRSLFNRWFQQITAYVILEN